MTLSIPPPLPPIRHKECEYTSTVHVINLWFWFLLVFQDSVDSSAVEAVFFFFFTLKREFSPLTSSHSHGIGMLVLLVFLKITLHLTVKQCF